MSIAVPPGASRSVTGTPPRVRTNSPKSTIFGQAADPSGRWRFVRVGAAIRNHAGRARAREGWFHAARAGARGHGDRFGTRVRVCDALGAPAPWPRSSVDRCSRGIVSTPRLGSAPPSPSPVLCHVDRRRGDCSGERAPAHALESRGCDSPLAPGIPRPQARATRATHRGGPARRGRSWRARASVRGPPRGTDAERRPRNPLDELSSLPRTSGPRIGAK